MNDVQAFKVLNLLCNYYKDEEDNLASVDAPSILAVGSNEWLIYVSYSCLLDYGVRSKIYHNNLINTYDKYSFIFNPSYVRDNLKKEELLKIMRENIHPRYPNVALDKWINLSSKLAEYDDLKKFFEVMSLEELEAFIKSIGGYGQKTGGLLIRLIVDAKVIKTSDDLHFIPIDRHDMEISYLNGIIDKPNLNENEIRLLSDILISKGHELGIRASTVDKYLWNVGNFFCNKGKCLDCPLGDHCKKGKRKEEV